jgi:hypothetical protein
VRWARSGAACAPASLLDAGDGDLRLANGGDENGDVEDAVLLRAEQLLAVVQEDVLVERVGREQLRHGARRVELGDLEPERHRLLEREVLRARVGAWKERRDDDAAMLDRVAELNG